MFRKQKGLTMNCENPAKIYVIEIKIVSSFPWRGLQKTRGDKMKVSLAMLLKTNVEKMSVYQPLAMLME